MSNHSYDDMPAVRRSELWEIRKSPAHYLYVVTHPKEQTPALAFGTAAHKYILEPDEFWDEYDVAPQVDKRTKAGKEAWAAFVESLEGREPITKADFETIVAMDEAILANPTARVLLKSGIHEVPITWRDDATWEMCKCRPDCITELNGVKYIVDYKTTTSCEGQAFERACRMYGYKLQAGMYTEGVFLNTFDDYRFAFVAQEKTPPYAVRVYFCTEDFVTEGTDLFHELLEIYHKCKEAGVWPGYEDKELLGDE